MGQYSLQVIVGSQAETLANAMKELSDAEANPSPLNSDGQTGTSIDIAAPIAGRVAVLSEVPDEVFAQKMIGDGLAIFPAEGSNQVCAPLAGTIASIFEAKHAFFYKNDHGAGNFGSHRLGHGQTERRGFYDSCRRGASELKSGSQSLLLIPLFYEQSAPLWPYRYCAPAWRTSRL